MVDTPASGRRAIYPKSSGWHEKNSAGVETRLLRAGVTFTIADDAAISFTPDSTRGIFLFVTNDSGAGYDALLSYIVGASPRINSLITNINFEYTTGVLAGTTGSDSVITFSAHTDGKIYVENRTGTSYNVTCINLGSST